MDAVGHVITEGASEVSKAVARNVASNVARTVGMAPCAAGRAAASVARTVAGSVSFAGGLFFAVTGFTPINPDDDEQMMREQLRSREKKKEIAKSIAERGAVMFASKMP
jgi:hypothetical protein